MINRLHDQFNLRVLRQRGAIDGKIQIWRIFDGHYMANLGTPKRDEVISQSVTSGIATTPERAALKAIVEGVERNAFYQSKRNNHFASQTKRSDGFAAFPVGVLPHWVAKQRARRNALGEAIERYVWATWWDDRKVAHEIQRLTEGTQIPYQEYLQKSFPEVTTWLQIRPRIDCSSLAKKPFEVIILLALLSPEGVVSGGAAGFQTETSQTLVRACGELHRHLLAVRRLRAQEAMPLSFYEQRLRFFGTGQGDELVRSRLSSPGVYPVLLPDFAIDSPIPHDLSDFVAVHRCLFHDQPKFVGGDLARLCI